MKKRMKHSCIENLLMQKILLKVEPGKRDWNPTAWDFYNTTEKFDKPRNLYILIIDENEIEHLQSEE